MHGNLVNGFSFDSNSVPGKNANALSFDGIDDYIKIPEGFSSLEPGFTVSLWAYPTAVKSWARFIDFGNGENADNIIFARLGSSDDLVMHTYDGTSAGSRVTASDTIELNKWQFFAASIDSNGNAALYKNGEVIGTGTTVCPPSVVRGNNYIGKSNWSSDEYYSGYMDDIRVFNYALSEKQIANIFDYRRELVHHWKLDDRADWTVEGEYSISGILDSVTGGFDSYIKTTKDTAAYIDFQEPGATAETGSSVKLGGRYGRIELDSAGLGVDEFTMMLWFKMNRFRGRDENDENYVVSADNEQSDKWSVTLSGSSTSRVELRFRQEGYGDVRLIEPVEDKSWYLLRLARNSRGDFRIYINDQLVHSGINNFEFTNPSDDNSIWIGNHSADNTMFDGWIDDVRIYNYAVDSAPDLTDDGLIGMTDFKVFLEYWLAEDCGVCSGADVNLDGEVNLEDFTVFSEYWLINEYEMYGVE